MSLGRLRRRRPRPSRRTAPTARSPRCFASYDLLAVAVTDEAGRLLGAVTVDDVIDRMLGDGWRTRSVGGRGERRCRGGGRREASGRPDHAARRRSRRGLLRLRCVRGSSASRSRATSAPLGTSCGRRWSSLSGSCRTPSPARASSSTRGAAVSCCSPSCCRCRRPTRRRSSCSLRIARNSAIGSPARTTVRSPNARRPTPSSSPARSPASDWRCPTWSRARRWTTSSNGSANIVERLADQVAQLTNVGAASAEPQPDDQGVTDSL